MIQVGSDFSGVGAFDQALKRLGIDYRTVYACDMDLHARETYMANYGEPVYYPFDVYEREVPEQPLDIYMTSPPCQAFSLAGKRNGEDDKRGVLFYNSHEFIVKNKPRYFIFENVKGLLSDNSGRTFQIWLDMLGGKSVNGNPVIFPREDATPYHIYHKVLNAKNYGVPQNRERVFIVGIRDDADNDFNWPKKQHLKKRLKDVLETEVDEKYYLSDKMVEGLTGIDTNGISRTIRVGGGQSADDKDNFDLIKVGYINQDTQASQVFHENGNSPNLCAGTHGYANGYVARKPLIAHIERTPEAKAIRRNSMANGKDYTPFQGKQIPFKEGDVMNCITTATTKDSLLINPKSVQKDNVVILHNLYGGFGEDKIREFKEYSPTIRTASGGGHIPSVRQQDYRIRRLTPRECFRLMDFPDTFIIDKVSNTQAYKQAGNSIVVNVLAEIIKKLKL